VVKSSDIVSQNKSRNASRDWSFRRSSISC